MLSKTVASVTSEQHQSFAAPATPLLEIDDLSVEYVTPRGPARAVDHVSFTIHEGEVFGLAGESGSGKSTIAHAILRVLRPPAIITGGHVKFLGDDVLDMNDNELEAFRWRTISMAFQSAMNSLNPVMTIGDQITDVVLTHLKLSKAEAEARAAELLNVVGIEQARLKSYPHQLSGGMRQRAVIAISLALNPDLMIMDEPTTALDVVVQKDILQQIDLLKRSIGFSILFITHDLSLMVEFSDRIGIMYVGEIVELAKAKDVFNDPKHPYTQGLINSFPALTGEKRKLTGIPGSPPDMVAPPSGCRFHPRCPYGWTNRATAYAFADFVDLVTRRFGDRVKNWITLNEPWCSAMLGYYEGIHAPGRRSLADGLAASHHLMLGHGLAMPIIYRNVPDAHAGITLNLTHAYPASDAPEDHAAAKRLDGYINRWFTDPLYGRGYPDDMWHLYGDAVPTVEADDLAIIAAPTDFLGINFYAPAFVKHDDNGSLLNIGEKRLDGYIYTDMNWIVYPDGLRDVITATVANYPVKQIYITENGAAFADEVTTNGDGSFAVNDPQRLSYYAQYLQRLHDAINDGMPVAGYFAWSLMDNFEWSLGYSKRFGLYYVDYETQQRILKDSGRWYAALLDRQVVTH